MRSPANPRLSALLTIDDMRMRARRVLPRALFDFVDGGALALLKDEIDLAMAIGAWRILADVGRVSVREIQRLSGAA